MTIGLRGFVGCECGASLEWDRAAHADDDSHLLSFGWRLVGLFWTCPRCLDGQLTLWPELPQ